MTNQHHPIHSPHHMSCLCIADPKILDFRTEDMVGEIYLETMDDFVVHRKIFDLEDQRGTYQEVLIVFVNSKYSRDLQFNKTSY